MSRVYVGPTTLYDLGQVGELDLLTAVDGELAVPTPVVDEITVEPAATALDRFLETESVTTAIDETEVATAKDVLEVDAATPSVAIVAGILAHADPEDRYAVGVVTEDRRLRSIAEGFGASTTSSFGVVVRAALSDDSLKPGHVKRIVRRMDSYGLNMTGELRERAVGEASG